MLTENLTDIDQVFPKPLSREEAVKLWEDTVGDSGQAPTDDELLAFANKAVQVSIPSPFEEL